MNHRWFAAAAMMLVLSSPSRSQSPSPSIEMLRDANFSLPGLRLAGLGLPPAARMAGQAGIWSNDGAKVEALGASFRGQAAAAADIELASIYNIHFKSRLRYNVNGVSLWISAARNRSGKDASVALSFGSRDPFFYNIRWLASQSPAFNIGADKRRYELRVDANIFQNEKSHLMFKNAASGRDEVALRLDALLGTIESDGREVRLSAAENGRSVVKVYRVYYYDNFREGDLRNGGGFDRSSQNIAFLLPGDDRITIVPSEQVGPEIRTFPLATGKRVGLKKDGGILTVYDVP